MHLRAQPPIFVPAKYRDEIEKLSKAALMDLVWDFATTNTPDDDEGEAPADAEIMGTLRERVEIILHHRRVA